MGPWYLHLPKSTFWDLFTCNCISWLLKAVKHGAFFSHLNGHWTSARPLPWRSTKFVAFKSLLITLKLSSSHSYQPLVLISTAQCITRLRSKRVFAKHSKSRDHHRYIDRGARGEQRAEPTQGPQRERKSGKPKRVSQTPFALLLEGKTEGG